VNLVQTGEKIVEELVATFVHERELAWLLPGVKATGRRLVVPMVSQTIFILYY
jgi:carboxymethylenebutenolidase